MKKIKLIAVPLLLSLLFSCESTAINEDDILDSPDTNENISAIVDENSNLLPSQILKEPEDFEEPLVRDLELPVIQETVVYKEEAPEEINIEETQPEEVLTQEIVTESEKDSLIEPEQVTPEQKVAELPKETAKENTPKAIKNPTSLPKAETKPEKIAEQKSPASEKKTIDADVQIPEALPQEESNPIVELPKKEVIPSREIVVNKNETITVRYPGYGWIYLGSDSENNNLVSTGRKIEEDETIYTLTAKNAGTQIHHFYKVDSLTGNYIDDYLKVTVTENQGSVYTIVKVPDYEEIVPQRPVSPALSSANKATVQEQSVKQEVKPTEKRSFETYTPEPEEYKEEVVPPKKTVENNEYVENLDADDLLKRAKELFDEKKYIESNKYVTSFLEIATSNRDEGLYLKGQILEQDGETKNIKESISTYETIVNNYPESYYWDDAHKRIIYLNRFYIQIR